MADEKNVPLVEEKTEEFDNLYVPNDKEMEVLNSTFLKFRRTADKRNRAYNYFDGLNIIEYIEDSVHRFTTNIDSREDIEDWQARVHDQITRNKVLAILGKIVSVLPIAKIKTRGSGDPRKGEVLSAMYEFAEDADDYEELMVNFLLEVIVKGTGIGYEGHEQKTNTYRDVSGFGDDIKVTTRDEVQNKLFGGIVPLEEFYPQSIGMRTINKDMVYCYWRNVIPFQQFRDQWATFDRVGLVQPRKTFLQSEKIPYFVDYISDDVPDGSVELIRYYNKDTDEYVIIANGIWLNPLVLKGDNWEVSPLPFNHKELPFWDIKFDVFGTDFFYGKSLPDRLKSMQDVLNVLTNMLLDQSFLTIFKPILTSGTDSIEDDFMRPGRRTPIDTQGLPLKDQYMVLDVGAPTGWHQFILEYTRRVMEESSVDKVSQGIAGVGDRVTAEEIKTAAEGVASLLGMFARFVNVGLKRKAMLKASNILQFWTNPDTPVHRKILGPDADKELNKAFNSFEIDNTTFSNGKRGMSIIEIFSDEKDLPKRNELKARAKVLGLENNKEVEIVAVPAQYIREFKFDVELVPDVKRNASREIDKALHLENTRILMSFFPDIVDANELAAQTVEKMGMDPTKILKPAAFNKPDEGAQNSEVDQGASARPTGNEANNQARGARGGETNPSALSGIQNLLTS